MWTDPPPDWIVENSEKEKHFLNNNHSGVNIPSIKLTTIIRLQRFSISMVTVKYPNSIRLWEIIGINWCTWFQLSQPKKQLLFCCHKLTLTIHMWIFSQNLTILLNRYIILSHGIHVIVYDLILLYISIDNFWIDTTSQHGFKPRHLFISISFSFSCHGMLEHANVIRLINTEGSQGCNNFSTCHFDVWSPPTHSFFFFFTLLLSLTKIV